MEADQVDQKVEKFLEWCTLSGIIAPKIKYPAIFENGLVGIRAVEPIEFREAFLYIPYKCLITTDLAQEIPELKDIVDNNSIFAKSHPEYEQYTLVLILLWEY